jgi:hypothetical protein
MIVGARLSSGKIAKFEVDDNMAIKDAIEMVANVLDAEGTKATVILVALKGGKV